MHVARHGGDIHLPQRLLFRFTKVDTDFLHAGGDHQNIGADLTREQRGGEIFIDHRIDAAIIPLFPSTTGIPPPPAPMTRKPFCASA
ncbi:Uncharacterised protein [Kluyvera cryocrescens]|uniref:Uncharacterized protein n=1 Tax=Kluyvera cryocrescens TaxID=580 RepID=A0A485AAA3_KLUCR|nr:Uncharacterised protein [Kluyvera cryocrescens]